MVRAPIKTKNEPVTEWYKEAEKMRWHQHVKNFLVSRRGLATVVFIIIVGIGAFFLGQRYSTPTLEDKGPVTAEEQRQQRAVEMYNTLNARSNVSDEDIEKRKLEMEQLLDN